MTDPRLSDGANCADLVVELLRYIAVDMHVRPWAWVDEPAGGPAPPTPTAVDPRRERAALAAYPDDQRTVT